LKSCVFETLNQVLIRLCQAGVRESNKQKFHSGEALDWSRLSFEDRAKMMRNTIVECLQERGGRLDDDEGGVILEIGRRDVFTCTHAVPATLGIAAARELVGRPFLNDYLLNDSLGRNVFGPIHLIACQKNATENQALNLLGFPDATCISAPFGVFVADNVQKVQFAFLTNCRDDTTSRHSVQRFFEWLNQSGEGELVALRAQSRKKIVHAIAKENG